MHDLYVDPLQIFALTFTNQGCDLYASIYGTLHLIFDLLKFVKTVTEKLIKSKQCCYIIFTPLQMKIVEFTLVHKITEVYLHPQKNGVSILNIGMYPKKRSLNPEGQVVLCISVCYSAK